MQPAMMLLLSLLAMSLTCSEGLPLNENFSYITNERRLYEDLMKDYNKYVRPAPNENDSVAVQFGLSVLAIEDLDEKSQVLIMHGWQKTSWIDYQLMWDPEDYGNINRIRIPASQLWTPDIVPFNALQENFGVSFEALALVFPHGMVLWIPVIRFKTSCPLDMRNFPFDEHNCHITFGSWTHDDQRINLSLYGELAEPEFTDYTEHLEWEVTEVAGRLLTKYYPCCPDEGYPDITYNITLRRRASHLNHVFIAPAVTLAFLIPVLFLLPPESGEKITMGTGLLVTLMLLMLMLENFMPTAHPKVPLIGLYYLASMVMVGFSLGTSALIVNVWFKSYRQKPLPALLRLVFLDILGKVLCVGKDEFSGPGYQPVSMRRLELMDGADGSLPADDQFMVKDRSDNSSGSVGAEWRQLAVVLDRICFILFFVVMFFITVSMAH